MASKQSRPKAPRGARITRAVVELDERDRPRPVRVTAPKSKTKRPTANELIQRGLAERSFI